MAESSWEFNSGPSRALWTGSSTLLFLAHLTHACSIATLFSLFTLCCLGGWRANKCFLTCKQASGEVYILSLLWGFISTLLAPLHGIFHLLLCVLRAICVLVPFLKICAIQTVKLRCPLKFSALWDPSGFGSNPNASLVGVCFPLPNLLQYQAGARLCLPAVLWLRHHPVKESALPHGSVWHPDLEYSPFPLKSLRILCTW